MVHHLTHIVLTLMGVHFLSMEEERRVPLTLEEKIEELEYEIRGYREEYKAARAIEDKEEKIRLSHLINKARDHLQLLLLQQARARARQGKDLYLYLYHLYLLSNCSIQN